MTAKDYQYFDCDNHCYEPRDAFTRYLPSEYLDRAITTVRNDGQCGDDPGRQPDRQVHE